MVICYSSDKKLMYLGSLEAEPETGIQCLGLKKEGVLGERE